MGTLRNGYVHRRHPDITRSPHVCLDPARAACGGRAARRAPGGEPFGTLVLALSLLVGAIGLGAGRTNMMQGGVQVVIFAAFLFLAIVP